MNYRKHPEFKRMLRETASKEALALPRSKSVHELPQNKGAAREPLRATVKEETREYVKEERRYKAPSTHEVYRFEEKIRANGKTNTTRESRETNESSSNGSAIVVDHIGHKHTEGEIRRIEHRAHERCMCQICTCNRPDHLCPINYIREGQTGNTNYRADYVPQHVDKPAIWKADDNLKTLNGPTGNTIYKGDYTKKKGPGTPFDNDRLVNTIVENNVKSHIKDLLGLPENLPRSKSTTPLESYEKPRSYIRPAYKPYDNGKLEKKTVYTKDFVPMKGDYEGQTRVNYDNLKAYNPDVPFDGNTMYRVEHGRKKDNKPLNDAIGEMIREQNRYTHPLHPEMEVKKRSEYKEEYLRKKVDAPHCAIYDLPYAEQTLLREGRHVFFDENRKNWHHH